MSNNKKSSVEWLYEEFERIDKDFHFGSYEYNNSKNIALKIAKAMHKEEIMEAHYAPKYGCFSEQYYNETFGGNK